MWNRLYKRDKFLIGIIASITLLLGAYLLFCVDIFQNNNSNFNNFLNSFASNTITFVSICFGFYITSISILASSKYITQFHEPDPKNTTQRKSHTLKAYLKMAVFLQILTIIVAFALLISILFNLLVAKVILCLLVCNLVLDIYFILLILEILFNVLIEQSKKETT